VSAPFGYEAGDTRLHLAAMTRRRQGDARHVDALHGEDYRALTAVQAPFHETVFEAVFAAADFTHIKRPVLYALYRELCRTHNNGYGTLKNRTLYAALDVWSKRRGNAVASRNVKWPKHRWGDAPETTADVLVLAGSAAAAEPRLENNDHTYLEEDGSTGRLRVRVEVS
jgi:hypothetical protein